MSQTLLVEHAVSTDPLPAERNCRIPEPPAENLPDLHFTSREARPHEVKLPQKEVGTYVPTVCEGLYLTSVSVGNPLRT